MRARYYQVASQRFVSEDPSGFNGGLNLYAYVGGNPLRYVDPDGLTPEEAAQWAQSQVGSLGYSWLAPNSKVVGRVRGDLTGGVLAPKCHIFVFDGLAAGGVSAGRVNGHVPTTADWMNGAVSGYRPVQASDALRGDVVVLGKHMGLFAPLPDGRPGTISASTRIPQDGLINPPVVHNDWGFRPGDAPRVFRAK